MPRIRTIKPEFFRHEKLQDLHSENPSLNVMLVYAGLWTQCDMNGVFVWQPRQMKLDILPFIDYDMCAVLDLLTAHGFIKKFSANGKEYGHIPTFLNNQHIPTKKEKSKEHRIKSVAQYSRIKKYCKSVLRIVSCDFNLENPKGHELYKIQKKLFENENTLDTVLRVNKHNQLAKDGIINIKQVTFLGTKQYASKYNKKTYLGKCSNCHEMCGVTIGEKHINHKGVIIQSTLFKLPVLKL